MSQILHIFRKDTRRFWIEILLSIAVTFAFALIVPNQWRREPVAVRNQIASLLIALMQLVPASWWLLIARVVHAETLVGDTQFWITRPYVWSKLLAAKALFVAVWLGVPLVLAQLLVLEEAGFPPLHFLPSVLMNLLLCSVIAFLPLAAVAAITANFARMTLTLLGGLIAIIALAFASTTVMLRDYSAYNPLQDWLTARLSLPLELLGCVAVILLMYATRRAWSARLLGAALAMLLFGLMMVYRGQLLVNRAYASPAAAGAVIQIAASTDANHRVVASIGGQSFSGDGSSAVYLNIPMRYSGVADGSTVSLDNVKFSLTAANGAQWSSPWQELQERYTPGEHHPTLALKMSTQVFDRFSSGGPVTLHLTFAESRAQAGATTQMPYPSGEVEIPGVGICYPGPLDPHQLTCRQVVRRGSLSLMTVQFSSVPCGSVPQAPEETAVGHTWVGPLQWSAELATTPVHPVFVWVPMDKKLPDGSMPPWEPCPGAPMTVTPYRLIDRGQIELTIPDFQMPPVAAAHPNH